MKISDYLNMILLASGMNNDTLNFNTEILLFCIFCCLLILFLLQMYQLYNRELLDALSGLVLYFQRPLPVTGGLETSFAFQFEPLTSRRSVCDCSVQIHLDFTQVNSADLGLRNMKESPKVSTCFSCYLEESMLHCPGVNADKVRQAPKSTWLQEFFHLDIQPKLILQEPSKANKDEKHLKVIFILPLFISQLRVTRSISLLRPCGALSIIFQ